MPRYCAVKVCRNRGGSASRRDNKRISFYPFPLLDKPRLQIWVDNIGREDWTPSPHQYLCSEHFTTNCFDIRWGIRYLKNTAIPTVFPSEGNGIAKRSSEAFDSDSTGSDRKRPLTQSGSANHTQKTELNQERQLIPDIHPATHELDLDAKPAASRSWGEEERVTIYEHTYCRQEDAARHQLRSQILSLRANILELDRREKNTVGKIQALEAEVALLKKMFPKRRS
ncbi:THAP domain-containing protein 5-like [Entelurus aequoreus]|uniref:THAP domain-containing protein 5-like n=1 Tax=Entelurus aequoreus TaxID=161455 RepID=UPI002B1E49A5|nr:THAP domain-containing protein 5-like [Entelurus aequoreus]